MTNMTTDINIEKEKILGKKLGLKFDVLLQCIENIGEGEHYASNKCIREVFGEKYKRLLDFGITNKLIERIAIDGRTNIYRKYTEKPLASFDKFSAKVAKETDGVEQLASENHWKLELLNHCEAARLYKASNSTGDYIHLLEVPSGSLFGAKDIVAFKEKSWLAKAVEFLKAS